MPSKASATEDSEYCWDCTRYRAPPPWRQRLNISRPGALENVGYALVLFFLLPLHLLMRTDDVPRTLAKCAGDLRCGIEQAGPFDFAVEALLTLVWVTVAVFSFYKLFIDRDDHTTL